MPNFRLALSMLRRDLRAGELSLLGVALFIAVLSLTSVGFFTDRVQSALQRDATQLLGGDLLASGDAPLPPAWRAQAEQRGLRATGSTNFSSMVSTGDQALLSGAKFVEPGYPLRGSLRIAQGMGQVGVEAGRIPAPGEAWVEERLLSGLNVKVGDTVSLGRVKLRVGGVITFESDRGNNFFSFIPRIMVNAADLAATELIQEGSRVRYRLQVAGDRAAVQRFESWLKPQIGAGQQLESLDNARPEIRGNLDRIGHFLQLAAMLSVVLAAVAIGLSARRYLQRHLDGCAVMRCYGAQRRQLLAIFLGEFALFALGVALLGCLGGFAVQALIAQLADSLIKADLPAPGLLPMWQGLVLGMSLMLGFIAPQLLHMTRVPPVHVIRREWGGLEASSAGAWVVGAGVLFLLFLWVAGDVKLGAWVAGGFAAACALFALLSRGLLSLLALGRHAREGDSAGKISAASWGWRYGLAAMHRRLGASLVQSVALGLGLMAMLLLGLVSSDLMRGWQRSLRPDAPNQFLLGIQADQRAPLTAFFRAHQIAAPELLPMIRGRLVSLNGKPVSPEDYKEDRAKNLVDREFNLSYASVLQEGNTVVAGRWHGDAVDARGSFSMEEGLGKTLGIHLGDSVTFDIAGQRVSGRVGSIRKLDWDSMRVNFFFTAAPGLLEPMPTSWITSFHLPDGEGKVLNELVAQFPNLSVIDVGAVIAQVQDLTGKLIRVVQFVFGFALLAGAVVLFAALRATHDERRHELAVLRTLGARNTQLRAAMLAEFLVLGVLSSVLALIGALSTGYVLALKVFDISYQPQWLLLVLCVVCAVLAVLAAGWLGVRGLLRRQVVESLRAV